MAYQALYRSYRPQTFLSVAGQKHIVTTLQNAIKLNKVAHAYLFTGPRGTGKTTMAKIMAKALNCVNGPTIEPCNTCSICEGINRGMISDVVEIDAASNNGVDEIRDLRDKVKYLPSECKYKVYIIDEVHMLSQGAFNALLKTLEEPPSHVIFILATTEPHKIPATILSRCQRFDFQAIDKEDIISRVKTVIDSEHINVTEDAINLIADYSDGGMRDALSLLDQSISYSTDDVIDENDILTVSGNVSNEQLLTLLSNIRKKNGAESLKVLNDIISKGKEIPRIINDLVIFLRDILLAKVGLNISKKAFYLNHDYLTFVNDIPSRLVYHFIDILNETLNNIKFTNQKRAYLELGILKMADSELLDYQELIEKVNKLERAIILNKDTKPKSNETINVNSLPFSQDPNQIMDFEQEMYFDPKPVDSTPTPPRVEIDDSYIKVKDIEVVLNNASKELKVNIQNKIKDLININPNDSVIDILSKGSVVCANNTSLVIVLQEISKCNRMIKDNYYKKALKYINTDGINISNLYFIPQDSWNRIQTDFTTQYKAGNKTPSLHEFVIPVQKHIEVIKPESTNNSQLFDLFDEKIIKIEEE